MNGCRAGGFHVRVHAPSPPCLTVETLKRLYWNLTLLSLTMCQDSHLLFSIQRLTDMRLYTWIISMFLQVRSEAYRNMQWTAQGYTPSSHLFSDCWLHSFYPPLCSKRGCGKQLDIKLFKRLVLHRDLLKQIKMDYLFLVSLWRYNLHTTKFAHFKFTSRWFLAHLQSCNHCHHSLV